MPPTIQSGKHGDRDHKSRSTVPKRSDIVCRIKYLNQLPDIPFDPKFIKYPFDPNRFVEYNATSLERNYKHELLAEHDLGVTIDLINPDTYRIDPKAVLDPKDEKLLEEEISTPGDSKRSQRHARNVSWLRKTEYISSEYSRGQQNAEKPETKVAYTLKKKFNEEDVYQDRNNQIKAIQKTFEDAKKPIEKHYSKPFVTPVEILPVFPDFETWIHPCAQVNFDSDPSVRGKTTAEQTEEMSQAMIRGMVDESEEQFVGYFLPSNETMGKRKRDFEEEVDYREDEEYEYKLTREYNWNVKNKASKGYEENYFFLFRKGKGVFFNELETRVRLSKRRVKEGLSSNSILVVRHRELSEQELAVQEARLSQLENVLPDDEDEEMDEEGEETQKAEGEGSEGEKENGEEAEERAEGSGDEEHSGEENEDKTNADSDREEQDEEGEQEEGEQEAEEGERGEDLEDDDEHQGAEEEEQGEDERGEEMDQDQEEEEERDDEEREEEEQEDGDDEGREEEDEGEQEEEQEQEEEAEEEGEQEDGEADEQDEGEDQRRDDEQEIFGEDSGDESW